MSRRKLRAQKQLSPAKATPSSHPNLWERYWFDSVAAIRPYLLMKAALILLAFDVWMVRLKNGAHYGLDGFNVAHFHWLDAVQPLPGASLHTGLLLLTGIFALFCVFAGPGRWALASLALAYTYGWAMSMLDDYQHHYFLSLVLAALVFFPRLQARDLYQTHAALEADSKQAANASGANKRRVSAWGYVLLGVNVAIVYFFTALTKAAEEQFLNGQIIQRMSRKKQLFQTIETWLVGLGLPSEVFWQSLALSTIAFEIFLSLTYLLAVRQDENRSRWLRIVTWCGFVVVVIFHGIGNEIILPLRIGWFSYYMIVLGCIYFLPESFLLALGRLLTWPALRLGKIGSSLMAALDRRGAALAVGLIVTGALTTGVAIVALGYTLDLPGATIACLLLAFSLVSASLLALASKRRTDAMRYVFATSLAVALMWTSVTSSMVRFDYYDLLSSYHRRRGNLQAAIEAHEKAVRYVPPGKRKILQQRLVPFQNQVSPPAGFSTSH